MLSHSLITQFFPKFIQKLYSDYNDLKLEIIAANETTVEFKAFYLDENLKAPIHHEKSTFVFEEGRWFYVDGIFF